jgi:16S rRNA (guanine(966)-N(2))-methyltransferase RsmD
MRIIAGAFKGIRLKAPKSQRVRPTSDRVREFIFSCIHMDVVNARVLDLFAGTGALGIEALSRGAQDVVFVDNSREAVELLQQNLSLAKASGTVHKRSAENFVKNADQYFDFIFCDPPYAFDHFELILQSIVEKNLLAENGVLIYESSSKQQPAHQPGLTITRQKKMGDTLITFYEKDHEDSYLSGNV